MIPIYYYLVTCAHVVESQSSFSAVILVNEQVGKKLFIFGHFQRSLF